MNSKSYIVHTIFPVELFQAKISVAAKYLYFVLSSFANKDGVCFPRLSVIKERSGIKNDKTVVKALKELERAGFIEIIRDRGKHNVYKLFPQREGKVENESEEKEKRSVLPDALLDKLKDFELNKSDIKKIESIYVKRGEEYVRSAILYTKKRAKENKSAYLMQTLLKDWAAKERKEMERQNAFEKAKQEYKQLIGKTVLIDGKEYRISDDGVISDKDAIPSGYIWEDWDYWKAILLKNLKGQDFLKSDGT